MKAEAKAPAGMETEDNWQATMATIKSRVTHAFERGILCDVSFILGGGEGGVVKSETMPAHKLLLSLSSTVFFTMFNGPIATGDRVVVTDVHPKAFRALLKYIYTEAVELDASMVMSTLYAAKKYQVRKLEEACEEFLLKSVSSENAVLLLSQGPKYFVGNNAGEYFTISTPSGAIIRFESLDYHYGYGYGSNNKDSFGRLAEVYVAKA